MDLTGIPDRRNAVRATYLVSQLKAIEVPQNKRPYRICIRSLSRNRLRLTSWRTWTVCRRASRQRRRPSSFYNLKERQATNSTFTRKNSCRTWPCGLLCTRCMPVRTSWVFWLSDIVEIVRFFRTVDV